MKNKLENYKRYIFLGIICTALGVTFSNNLKEDLNSLGIVFIAVGGLFFIIGMSKKRNIDETKNK